MLILKNAVTLNLTAVSYDVDIVKFKLAVNCYTPQIQPVH